MLVFYFEVCLSKGSLNNESVDRCSIESNLVLFELNHDSGPKMMEAIILHSRLVKTKSRFGRGHLRDCNLSLGGSVNALGESSKSRLKGCR